MTRRDGFWIHGTKSIGDEDVCLDGANRLGTGLCLPMMAGITGKQTRGTIFVAVFFSLWLLAKEEICLWIFPLRLVISRHRFPSTMGMKWDGG